jgi:H2-forming N5,N10-methylenetetrahydromethanopterin dehydrogenase-like enzyme
MDVLIPFVAVLDAAKACPARKGLKSALIATKASCKKIEELESVFGRALYILVKDEGFLKGIANLGALGLIVLIKGILEDLLS